MEFPDLGSHCSDSSCKQLDFLPMICDSCQKIYWKGTMANRTLDTSKDHFSYTNHNCPESHRKDNQVPVCPLCNIPIAVKKGIQPDYVVGIHIDTECQSDPALRKRKKSSNKCSKKGCKQKELIPFKCERCHMNYCVRHRLDTDHECKGFDGSGRGMSNAGAAALIRNQGASTSTGPFKAAGTTQKKPQLRQQKLTEMGKDLDRERRERAAQPPQPRNLRSMQAGMSEDEAMARALALSMQGGQHESTPSTGNRHEQEEADEALARALQASEQEAMEARHRPQRQTSKEKSCSVS